MRQSDPQIRRLLQWRDALQQELRTAQQLDALDHIEDILRGWEVGTVDPHVLVENFDHIAGMVGAALGATRSPKEGTV